MDADDRSEFGARLRAMAAYAGVDDKHIAAHPKFKGRAKKTEDRAKTIRKWMDGEMPAPPVCQELAEWLAAQTREVAEGIPASFLWPPPFPPIVRASAAVDEAVRRQLAEAVSAIEAAQGLLPPAKDA